MAAWTSAIPAPTQASLRANLMAKSSVASQTTSNEPTTPAASPSSSRRDSATISISELSEAAAAAAASLNSEIEIVAESRRLELGEAAGVVGSFDVVCDATDDFAIKFALNDVCVGAGVALVHAAILQYGGQVTTVVPGGPCYRCLFGAAPDPEAVPTCAQAGILGPVAAVVGGLQATEALKLILGVGEPLSGRLLVYDGLRPRARTVEFGRDPRCAAPHNPAL